MTPMQVRWKAGRCAGYNMLRLYETGMFWYELGIDPGIRTWNATVRRSKRTSV